MVMSVAPIGVFALLLPVVAKNGPNVLLPLLSVIGCVAVGCVCSRGGRGVGEEAENVKFPKIYNSGLVTIGECSVVPDGVKVGKNTAISGVTTVEDYPDGLLPSGGIIIKAGEVE